MILGELRSDLSFGDIKEKDESISEFDIPNSTAKHDDRANVYFGQSVQINNHRILKSGNSRHPIIDKAKISVPQTL